MSTELEYVSINFRKISTKQKNVLYFEIFEMYTLTEIADLFHNIIDL